MHCAKVPPPPKKKNNTTGLLVCAEDGPFPLIAHALMFNIYYFICIFSQCEPRVNCGIFLTICIKFNVMLVDIWHEYQNLYCTCRKTIAQICISHQVKSTRTAKCRVNIEKFPV